MRKVDVKLYLNIMFYNIRHFIKADRMTSETFGEERGSTDEIQAIVEQVNMFKRKKLS